MKNNLLYSIVAATSALQFINGQGKWTILGDIKVTCIHTALLPNQRVLCAERPHELPYSPNEKTNGRVSVEIDLSQDLNVTIKHIDKNPFCAGHAQMANGDIFLAGGENGTYSDPETGEVFLTDGKKARREYNVCADGDLGCTSSGWEMLEEMTSERWYPTITTLASGKQIIVGGTTASFDFETVTRDINNPTYEYWPIKPNGTNGNWPKTMEVLEWGFPYNLYPPVFQLPSGGVFIFVSNRTLILDEATDTLEETIPPILLDDKQPWIYPYTPTALMLPLLQSNNYEPTVQVCGGNYKSSNTSDPRCIAINMAQESPQWKEVEPLPAGRIMPDSIILPDATVLYTNGAGKGIAGGDGGDAGQAIQPVLSAHIFDPRKEEGQRFSEVASSQVPRMYHSVALLLQDGRVAAMGSEIQNYVDFVNERWDCFPFNRENVCTDPFENRLEVYEPAYLSLPQEKPVIKEVKGKMTYGSTFVVTTETNGLDVNFVSAVRYSTATHSTNTDQRLVELKIIGRSKDKVYLEAPKDGNLAPPGNWMLFLLNDGKPSVSKTIQLNAGPVENVDVPPEAAANSHAMPMAKGQYLGLFIALFVVLVFSC